MSSSFQVSGMAASRSSSEAVLGKPGDCGGEAPILMVGGVSKTDDDPQAQRDPSTFEPEERFCEDGYGSTLVP